MTDESDESASNEYEGTDQYGGGDDEESAVEQTERITDEDGDGDENEAENETEGEDKDEDANDQTTDS